MPKMGGSVGWADRDTGVAVGLTRNRLNPTEAEAAIQIGNLVAKSLAR